MGWGGAWPPASLAIGSRGTRLRSGEAGSRAGARVRAWRAPPPPRSPRLPSPRLAARPSAPPPLPAPCRCLSASVHRASSSEGTRGLSSRPSRAVSGQALTSQPEERLGTRAGARRAQPAAPASPSRGASRLAPRLWTCPFLCVCGRSRRLGRSEPRGRRPRSHRGHRFAMEGAGGENEKKK